MKPKSIEQLVALNKAVIIDVSAISHLNSSRKKTGQSKTNKGMKIQHRSMLKLRQLAEETNKIYVTSGVYEELMPQKLINCLEMSSLSVEKLGRDARLYKETIKSQKKKFTKLKKKKDEMRECLMEGNKVLNFSSEEEYQIIDNACRKVKEYCELSEADWEFLISGIILSRQINPVCLISNDSGIWEAYKLLLECRLFQEGDLTFYFRENFESYCKVMLGEELKKAISNRQS